MTVTTIAVAKLTKPVAYNLANLRPITAPTSSPSNSLALGSSSPASTAAKTLGTHKVRLLLVIVFTIGMLWPDGV